MRQGPGEIVNLIVRGRSALKESRRNDKIRTYIQTVGTSAELGAVILAWHVAVGKGRRRTTITEIGVAIYEDNLSEVLN